MSSSGALAGLRVLDLTTLLAAPQIAAMLGDFGADVVKLEPRGGDPLRQIGVRRGEGSPAWAWVARNKRTITLDLDVLEGQELFARLIDEADVLVENLTPSLRARWHCDYATLAARNPRLVVVSVSCFGQSGPLAAEPGAGALAEAFAGFAHMTGEANGPPLLPSLPLGDAMTGFSGALGVLLACYARDRQAGGSGRGQHVDVSMFEPILQLLGLPIATWDGVGAGPKRNGSRVEGGVPRNLYRCGDGAWIALSGTTDAQVARVLEVVGRDAPADRARYGKSAARLAVADELDGLVAEWIARHDRAVVLATFRAARVPVAPVNDVADLMADAHVRARASVERFADAELGEVALVAPTPKLGSTPGRHIRPGPALSAHTDEVLREWLALSSDEIARLRAAKAI
ncbi:MAG: CoA transferase [Deltaproteobacteria bacterium]|nr:CoA transferase [Deltaproteobacteria bacterium]